MADARRFKMQYSIGCTFAIGILWAAIFYNLQAAYERAIHSANTHGHNIALSLAERVGSSVQEIDLSLLHLRDDWIDNRKGFEAAYALQKKYLDYESVAQVGILNDKGMLAWSSTRGWRPIDYSDREHFQFHKSAQTDVLSISKPLQSRILKRWSLNFTRAIYDHHKKFAGMIAFSVPPLELEKIYKEIELGAGGRISLVRSDGHILARTQGFDQIADGPPLPGSTPGLKPGDSPEGNYRHVSPIDGVDSFISYRKVSGHPLVLYVLQPVSTVLAPYYEQRNYYLAFGGLATVLLAAFTLVYISRSVAHHVVANNQRLLAAMVESANDAIITRDLSGAIVTWNSGAERLYGYTAAEAIGRDEFLTPPDLADHVAQLRQSIKAGQEVFPTETARLTKDGRRIDVMISASPIFDKGGKAIGWATIAHEITERKNAEKLAEESKRRILEAQRIARVGNYWFDSRSGVWSGSEVLHDILGIDASYPKTLDSGLKLVHPQSRETIGALWADCIHGAGKELDAEYRIRRANDEAERWVQLRGKIVRDDEGKATGVTGTIQDITERKRAELILQARLHLMEISQMDNQERLLQDALDTAEALTGSSIGFFHFVEANQENLILKAWSTNTLKNMCTAEGKDAHYAISTAGVWADCFHTRKPVIHNDYQNLKHKKGLPEGHAAVTRELVVPIIRRGRVTEIMGVGNKSTDYTELDVEAVKLVASMVQDILDRQRSEHALQQSEERFSTVFQGNPIATAIIGVEEGRILEANEAALDLFGYKRGELIGHELAEIDCFQERDTRKALKSRLRESGRIDGCEMNIRQRSGTTKVVSLSARILKIGVEDCIVGMLVDVTARKHAEAELKALNEDLEKRIVDRTAELKTANKELEAFSYSVSHDLRAPLRSISGFGGFLLEENAEQLNNSGKDRLQRILSASKRMEALIEDLMNLSKVSRQEIQRQKVDLSEMAGKVVADLKQHYVGRDAHVIVQPAMNVYADAGLMRIVLENLIGNAWKFTAKAHDPTIEIGVIPRNGASTFYVRDNGAGFDMTYANKLFTPFQRLHSREEFEGSGIGLSIVNRIVAKHGGKVWAESERDKGTTFYFTC